MVPGRFELDFDLVGAVNRILEKNGYGKAEKHKVGMRSFITFYTKSSGCVGWTELPVIPSPKMAQWDHTKHSMSDEVTLKRFIWRVSLLRPLRSGPTDMCFGDRAEECITHMVGHTVTTDY